MQKIVTYLAALIVLALLAAAPVVAEPLSPSQRFQFELWAQNHCPTDAVVWVDRRSQFYNSSEERWYGRTTNGAFRLQARRGERRLSPQAATVDSRKSAGGLAAVHPMRQRR